MGRRRKFFGRSYRNIRRGELNMFTVGGGHAKLSCRQGIDLQTDVVCELVPFFMP